MACAMVVLITAILLSRKIEGGAPMFSKVSTAIKRNEFLQKRLGTPITSVEENDGPKEVSLGGSGDRDGYYSVNLVGPKGAK